MLGLLHRSLLLQTVTIVLATLALNVLVIQTLLQTNLIFRLFPSLLEDQAAITLDLADLLAETPAARRARILSAFSDAGRAADLRADFPQGARQNPFLAAPFERAADATGMPAAPTKPRFQLLGALELMAERRQGNASVPYGLSLFEVSIPLATGEILIVRLTPLSILGPYLRLLLLINIAIFAVVSVAGLRLAFRPLRRLEGAADSIGRTSRPDLIEETGSEDIRRVARALNAMQARIQALLSERSQMVAAIAHDIRTSLTHIKLRLETDAGDVASIETDVEQMDALVSDMLLYARAERPPQAQELINLGALVSDLVTAWPRPLLLQGETAEFWVACDPAALRRSLTNLIDNAEKYGGQAAIICTLCAEGFQIAIEDDGPGIPDAHMDHIFDPFYRVEGSRSRGTGGTGLGLTIARALLGAQGATLRLINKKTGGLQALVTFSAQCRIP